MVRVGYNNTKAREKPCAGKTVRGVESPQPKHNGLAIVEIVLPLCTQICKTNLTDLLF